MSELHRPTVDLDVWALELSADPGPVWQSLLESGTVWTERNGGHWMVSRYEDVQDIARNTRAFSSAGNTVPDIFNLQCPLRPSELDPPDHQLGRSLIAKSFARVSVAGLEVMVRSMTIDFIDSFADGGSCDFAQQLAHPLPCSVIAAILGVPDDELPMMHEASTWSVRASVTGETSDLDPFSYSMRLVEKHRAVPGDGLIGDLIRARPGGEPLTDAELVGFLVTLIGAGQDTTSALISHCLIHLSRSPADRATLIDNPDLIPSAVEELLRVEAPVHTAVRTVTQEVEISGTAMAPGDKVVLMLGAANRDAGRFHDPTAVLMDRTPNHHLAFGFGIHRCVGLHLGRLEARVVLEEVLRRLPDYAVASESEIVRYNLGGLTRGVWSLPAVFTPAE
jgi:cytochrome P450